ncbi:hypothetical protein GGR28_001710 [Lewinella aquimaris]|uniref:Uncharacterized protein n=1 Tax=Neolewinella aquimaris TaxID=1835722 RepID=A0A840E566_9BACT|nr:hypothetical protein [Neolewinella aquimaris]MBB4079093.1 hypothetical protein [Neolewinella aquimaris]
MLVMLRTTAVLLLTTLASVSGGSCTEDQRIDFSPLERQLMIVWIGTEWNHKSVVTAYNSLAQHSWRQLREKYVSLPLTDREKVVVRMFDLWMTGLNASLDNGQSQTVAMHLQHLRNALQDLRPQYGIDHPADVLYDFIRSWEWVEEISHDQMMCLVEWNEYRDAYERAAEKWQESAALTVGYSDHLFPGLTRYSAQAENARVTLSVALVEFGELIQRADHGLMAVPSEEIRDHFFYYLAVITDYPFAAPAI